MAMDIVTHDINWVDYMFYFTLTPAVLLYCIYSLAKSINRLRKDRQSIEAVKIDQKYMVWILALIAFCQALFGMIDAIMVMNEVFSSGYCSITWLTKSFSTNSSALIGSVYLYFVKGRIQDPMTQNLKREFTFVAIAVGSSLFVSSKSYLFKCSY